MEMLKSIHWDITKQCNLRCFHCYNSDKYFNTESELYIDRDMSLEESLKAVDHYYEWGFRHIHMLGGEPLTSPYLFEIIQRAKQWNMMVTINSNAVLLDEMIQMRLIELKVDQFAASLDGCSPEINDSIRGAGTFAEVCANMRQFNRLIRSTGSQLQTVFVFTLTKANIHELIKLPELAAEVGVNLITLTTFIESGRGRTNRTVLDLEYQWMCDEIEKMVERELIKYSVPLQIDMRPRLCDYLALKYNAPVIYNIKNSLCSAGEDMWYMESNGDVHPCLIYQLDSGKKALSKNLFIKQKLNVNQLSIDEIGSSGYWTSFCDKKHEFQPQRISTCEDCNSLEHCSPCFLDYGEYDRPIIECEWTKKKELESFDMYRDSEPVMANDVELSNDDGVIMKDKQVILELGNGTAQDICEQLRAGKKPMYIYETIMSEYDVDEYRVKSDIMAMIFRLRNYGLLQIL